MICLIAFITINLIIPEILATSTTKGDLLTNFILRCQNSSGGFKNCPENAIPDMQSTFQAVYTLSVIGKLNSIGKKTVAVWINETQNIDGGFPNIENQSSTLESTYFAVKALLILGYTPCNNITEYINQCWNADYGFGNTPNSSSNLQSTYYALSTLRALGVDISVYKTEQWLIPLQNNISEDYYGAFSSDGKVYNILSTCFALMALNLTNNIAQINKTSAYNWVKSCQNTDPNQPTKYGSYSSTPTTQDYSVMNCYAALSSFVTLGLEIPLKTATKEWILKCQNLESGGFSTSTIKDSSTVASSYYAICALEIIGDLGFLSTEISTGLSYNLSIWIILLIIIVAIISIYIVKKYLL